MHIRLFGESKLDTEIWRVISDMSGLQELTLLHLVVDASVLLFFDKICTRLKTLHLYADRVDISDSIKTSAPWKIRELSISEHCQIDTVAFTARCPTLEILGFNTKEGDLKKCQSFAQHLDSGALPCLRHLDLKVVARSDEDMASYIRSMRGLRKFESYGALGPLSLPTFRPHFRTITEIRIRDLFGGMSGLWQEIMSSCPLLTRVEPCKISVNDILNGRPWVCTSMKALYVDINPVDDNPDTVGATLGSTSDHGLRKYEASELENIVEVVWVLEIRK
ncbi:hypothetical protein BGX28_000549 [Mortierella sp. GBA30]|nr:hypothetical protein BGX28_000549 [Mortierella sp. GBA30]